MDDLTNDGTADDASGMDRRSLLKKAAVGGAVAFAAPVILSKPAFALASQSQLRVNDTLVVSNPSVGARGDHVLLQLIPPDDACVVVAGTPSWSLLSFTPLTTGNPVTDRTGYLGALTPAFAFTPTIGASVAGLSNVAVVSYLTAPVNPTFFPAGTGSARPNTYLVSSTFKVQVSYTIKCGAECSSVVQTAEVVWVDNEQVPVTSFSGNGQVTGPDPDPFGGPGAPRIVLVSSNNFVCP